MKRDRPISSKPNVSDGHSHLIETKRRNDIGEIDDLDLMRDGLVVVPHRGEAVTMQRLKASRGRTVLAQHAGQGPPVVEEPHRDLVAHQIHDPPLYGPVGNQVEEIYELRDMPWE